MRLVESYLASVFFVFFVLLFFEFSIGTESFNHQVEVDFMPVEFRSVDANEFGFVFIFLALGGSTVTWSINNARQTLSRQSGRSTVPENVRCSD